MKQRPVILITASTQKAGVEFGDASLSLSDRYIQAVLAGGGLPIVAPCVATQDEAANLLSIADGLLLTGGDDLDPKFYAKSLPKKLERTVGREHPRRDLLEFLLIDEVFRQAKPVFGICRGHQIMNVALGGDLIVDIPQQVSNCLAHRRTDKKSDYVHEVAVAPGSLAGRITRKARLGVNSSHHQAVGKLSQMVQMTAASSDGVIEACELLPECRGTLPWFLTVQWHPERLFDRYTEHLALFQEFVRVSGLARRRKGKRK